MDYKKSEEYKSFHWAYEHKDSEDGLFESAILAACAIVGWLLLN